MNLRVSIESHEYSTSNVELDENDTSPPSVMTWMKVANKPILHCLDFFAVPEQGFSSIGGGIGVSIFVVKVAADKTFCGVLKFATTLPNVTSSGLRSHDGVRKYDLRIEAIFAFAVEAQSRSRCLHPESVSKQKRYDRPKI